MMNWELACGCAPRYLSSIAANRQDWKPRTCPSQLDLPNNIQLKDHITMDPVQMPLDLNRALQFIDKVKVGALLRLYAALYSLPWQNRFQSTPDLYQAFLKSFNVFKTREISSQDLLRNMASIFEGHPDLMEEFDAFQPNDLKCGKCDTEELCEEEDPQDQTQGSEVVGDFMNLSLEIK
jgi:histone deacetylase complex regulatory component SIN3